MNLRDTALPAVAEVVDAVLELTVVGSFSQVGYRARRQLFDWTDPEPGTLTDHTVLVTGASSGLGLTTAQGLASLGAEVILLGRDRERTEHARRLICAAVPGAETDVVIADLSRLDDVRRAAAEMLERHERLDVVVHNAGTLTHDFVTTVDGLELTAQTHVVAPFLLTSLLLPRSQACRARVITVTSGGMYTTRPRSRRLGLTPRRVLRRDQGLRPGQAGPGRAQRTVGRSKRSNRSGVPAMHPGWADTPGVQSSLPAFHRLVGPILRTPEQGVDTTLWLSTEPDLAAANGRLWLDRHRRRTVHLPGTATSEPDARQLWDWCAERAGIDVLPSSPERPAIGPNPAALP